MPDDPFKSFRQSAVSQQGRVNYKTNGDRERERDWRFVDEMLRVSMLATEYGHAPFVIVLTTIAGVYAKPKPAYGSCVPRVGDLFKQEGRQWIVESVRHDVSEDGDALQFMPFVFAAPHYG